MNHLSKYAVVLAAGKGTRMKSELPKVLMEVAHKPMILHVLDNLIPLNLEQIVIVVGYKKELVIDKVNQYIASNYDNYKNKIFFVEQKEQLGTGHAFLMTESLLGNKEGYILVTAGDMPLLQTQSFSKLFDLVIEKNLPGGVLGSRLENPTGYGRLVRNEQNLLERIIEEKDATDEIKKIKEVNTGCYVFKLPEIFAILKEIKNNNNQNEYYLPDVVEIYRKKNQNFGDFILNDYRESLGANTKEELENLNHIYNLLFTAK
ncbi:MAG: hypothetical protein KatS3mg129_0137 [Leptospiraceae bacterium]|nr:MAG: hypothetical protein KatS3mg129_0137 [Leptospiraceae bacterium]